MLTTGVGDRDQRERERERERERGERGIRQAANGGSRLKNKRGG